MWFRKKTIQDLNVSSVLSEQRMVDLRKKIQVLVVDDDVQGHLDESLRRCGYANVNTMRDIERIDDVAPYNVILVDVCGVGTKLGNSGSALPFEGLSLAGEIKRQYPLKKVIAYSAMLQQFEANYILKTVVDASFEKGPQIEARNTAIDDCIKASADPRKVWDHFRRRLLDADVPITQIAKMEDYFVSSLLKRRPLNQDKFCSFLKNAAALVGFVSELIKLMVLFGAA